MRAGDVFEFRGERLLCAGMWGDRVLNAGWPSGTAPLDECTVVKECSDAEHRKLIGELALMPPENGQEDVRRTEARRIIDQTFPDKAFIDRYDTLRASVMQMGADLDVMTSALRRWIDNEAARWAEEKNDA